MMLPTLMRLFRHCLTSLVGVIANLERRVEDARISGRHKLSIPFPEGAKRAPLKFNESLPYPDIRWGIGSYNKYKTGLTPQKINGGTNTMPQKDNQRGQRPLRILGSRCGIFREREGLNDEMHRVLMCVWNTTPTVRSTEVLILLGCQEFSHPFPPPSCLCELLPTSHTFPYLPTRVIETAAGYVRWCTTVFEKATVYTVDLCGGS